MAYTPVFKEGNVDLSEFDYPRWEQQCPFVDDDIKLKIVKRFICYNKTSTSPRTIKGTNIKVTKNSTDEEFLKYFDCQFADLLDPQREIIKRKDWAVFDDLCGESLEILNHPIFEKMAEYIRNNSKQQSDFLVVCSCGHKKPYSTSQYFQGYTTPLRYPELKNAFDLVVLSNSGVIPINEGNDFSFCYPFRYYDWNHGVEESKGLKQSVEDKMYFYIKEYIKSKNYKKIAISSRETYDSYIHIFNKLKDDFPEIEFLWVYDKQDVIDWLEPLGYKQGTQQFRMLETRFLYNACIVASKVLKFFYGYVHPVWLEHIKRVELRKQKK